MKRRDFLRLTAYGGLALGVPFVAGCHAHPANKAIAEPPFLMHIFDRKVLIETGKAWLVKYPQENSSSKLEELLISKSPIQGSTDAETVHQYFDQECRKDFEQGRIDLVDGWVLSVTEARQCALYSLEEA